MGNKGAETMNKVTRDNISQLLNGGYKIICMGSEVYQGDNKENTKKHILAYIKRGYKYTYEEK